MPIVVGQDTAKTRKTLTVNGASVAYYSIAAAEAAGQRARHDREVIGQVDREHVDEAVLQAHGGDAPEKSLCFRHSWKNSISTISVSPIEAVVQVLDLEPRDDGLEGVGELGEGAVVGGHQAPGAGAERERIG